MLSKLWKKFEFDKNEQTKIPQQKIEAFAVEYFAAININIEIFDFEYQEYVRQEQAESQDFKIQDESQKQHVFKFVQFAFDSRVKVIEETTSSYKINVNTQDNDIIHEVSGEEDSDGEVDSNE